MKRTILLAFCAILCFQTAKSQDFDAAKLNTYFDALESNDKFMGSVAVNKNGKLLYSRTIGYRDVENKIKPDAFTQYRIGSISKTFTAVLVMQAVEEGLLRLSDPLSRYYPNIVNADKITIEHLLNHRSGVHNITEDPAIITYYNKQTSKETLVDYISKAGSDFEPGTKYAYSNSNYLLLTFILEEVTKKDYPFLLKSKITEPLELTKTGYGTEIKADQNQSKSYQHLNGWLNAGETHPSVTRGAGCLISTPTDLAKFGDALFGGKLLQASSLEKMKAMQDNYGYGLFTIPFYGRTGIGHNGKVDGFNSLFGHFAEGQISIAILSNGINTDFNSITVALLSAIYNRDYEIPTFVELEVSEEDRQSYLGTYASADFPLKLTVTQENTKLFAQATGQGAFPLEATAHHNFRFLPAGIVIVFNPTERSLVLSQAGKSYTFKREE